jgi:hypothetical protein
MIWRDVGNRQSGRQDKYGELSGTDRERKKKRKMNITFQSISAKL